MPEVALALWRTDRTRSGGRAPGAGAARLALAAPLGAAGRGGDLLGAGGPAADDAAGAGEAGEARSRP